MAASGKVRMIMEGNKRKKVTLLSHVLIGLIISFILGIAESQILLDKPLGYRENMFWKYTILLYCITGAYTVWLFFFKKYLPILINTLKFLANNLILSSPYFLILIITTTVSIDMVLKILPAQIILLAGGFIWFISWRIDPDVGEYSPKILLKGVPVLIIVIAIAVFNNISEAVILFLASLIILGESLLLLRQARKRVLNSLKNN